jgi:hypothetical protein
MLHKNLITVCVQICFVYGSVLDSWKYEKNSVNEMLNRCNNRCDVLSSVKLS